MAANQSKRVISPEEVRIKEIESDERLHKRVIWADLGKNAIKFGSWALVAYFAQEVLQSFAGKNTNATLQFVGKFLTDDSIVDSVGKVLAVVTTTWAFVERRFRKNKTKTLSQRIQDLELTLDKNRTSSNLSPTGDTRKEDI